MIKAITVKEAGAANTMRITDLPKPMPKDNEIVIEQRYAGVNYGDAIRRQRGLFTLNDTGYFIPGFEGVGEIVALGKDVTEFKVGDRVGYLSEMSGGYSQQVSLNEKLVFPVPANIPDEIAAAMTCVGVTAWHLIELSKITQGSNVLIHGATGGVGLVLIQLCILRGANVIPVVGTQKKKDFLKQHYNVDAFLRRDGHFSEEILIKTNGSKLDVIFDCVGQAVLDTNLNIIRKGGVILYYGSTSGHPLFPGMQILMNSLEIKGFNIFSLISDTITWRAELQKFFELVANKKIDIYVDRVFKMDEAYLAHELLEDRNSIGKLLLLLE